MRETAEVRHQAPRKLPQFWISEGVGNSRRTGCAAAAVQKFPLAIDLHFAPRAMIAELAIELPAVLPDGPEMFASPRLMRRSRAFGAFTIRLR